MKLIIEIDVDMSDFDNEDVNTFLREAKDATGLTIEVGRSVSEEESDVLRLYSLSTEYFKCHTEQKDN